MSKEHVGAKAAFDYLYKSTGEVVVVDGPRALCLDHLEALATAVDLDTSNLSVYVLAYYFQAAESRTYTILESRFVQGMANVWPSRSKCNESNHFAPAFKALQAAVHKVNERIITSKEELLKFYRFLYQWCLKPLNDGNENDEEEKERRTIAVELWKLFFYTGAEKPSPLKHFLHYQPFPRLGDWLDYVQSDDFRDPITLDLWQELIPFSKVVSYDRYDPEDAWPVATDNFVEWQKAKEVRS